MMRRENVIEKLRNPQEESRKERKKPKSMNQTQKAPDFSRRFFKFHGTQSFYKVEGLNHYALIPFFFLSFACIIFLPDRKSVV